MGKVIRFPIHRRFDLDEAPSLPLLTELPVATEQQLLTIDEALRHLLKAIQRGRVKPERLFLVFEQGNTFSYLNLDFPPDELVRAVDLVLQDIARGYDSD